MEYQCTEERFLKDVERHEMIIVKDDELHRHIRFKRPDTRSYYFDLITWPGYLCYTGDMGTFVFQRVEDMFYFFQMDENDFNHRKDNKLQINPSYWGEKLQAISKFGGYDEFSNEAFRERVLHFLERDEDDDPIDEEIISEIQDSILDRHFENEYEAYQAINEFGGWNSKDARYSIFTDFWESDCRVFTFHYIWCCYALNWATTKYFQHKDSLNETTNNNN